MVTESSRQRLGMRPRPSISGAVIAMPNRSETDEALIGRIRNERDRNALDTLALHYGPRLKSWLTHRGEEPSTAEDIVQDVLVSVWVKAHKFDPTRGKFSTWVFRLTRNRWIDHKRKSKKIDVTDPDDFIQLIDTTVNGADSDYAQNEISVAIHKQLALLPTDQKQLLYLSFFEGLSHGEIAKKTGLPLGTVKSRIRSPLKKMQQNLAEFSEYFDE
ncbi:sigma-70 family RNA polymerase sigma factor [Hyphococcus lacteus]|uniref:Sigma-70 family RNA polymerase sigma factor n=1 Tax=Hyphococcus lacteus TaxID=3143536 RepID=A0ABV3Z3A9_9PROT